MTLAACGPLNASHHMYTSNNNVDIDHYSSTGLTGHGVYSYLSRYSLNLRS